jgi:hypothetical protein
VGSTANACAQTYHGTGPASEPETQAVQAYVQSIFPDQRGPGDTDLAPPDASGVFISLHSYGRLVLFPWGDTRDPAPNQAALQTLGRKFGYFNDYFVCQPSHCLYQTSGTTDDWAYADLGVAAFTFELGEYFFESCSPFENVIWPGNLPALRYALKAARNPYQAPAGPDSLAVTASPASLVAGEPLTLTAAADDTRSDGNFYGSDPAQPVAAARYTLDEPAWVTGTAAMPMAAADGAFDSPVESVAVVVDTTGWTPGRHLVLVESQDADGNWGVPSGVFVDVTGTTAALAPAQALAAGPAGQALAHPLWVTNTNPVTATFALTATGGAWPISVPPVLGPLGPGQGVALTATVDVPAGAAPGAYDRAVVSVAPQSPAGAAVTATLTSVVETPYGLIAEPATAEQAGQVGSVVTHTLDLTAIGSLTGTYSLTVSSTWPVSAPAGVGPLAFGGRVLVPMEVHIPLGLAPNAQDTLTLTLSAGEGPVWSTTVERRTTALWHTWYYPVVHRQ